MLGAALMVALSCSYMRLGRPPSVLTVSRRLTSVAQSAADRDREIDRETLFFLWFAFPGWMFWFLIFAAWILPFAAPLLIGSVANNLVIKGACPACKRQFVGYKNQEIRCAGCQNIVATRRGLWFRGGGSNGRGSSGSKSDPDIIDVEFEEK